MENDELRPTRVIINVDNLIHNIHFVREKVGEDTLVCAVVKGDAYGHGAVEVSKIFLENGADRLAVSSLDEGTELRNAGIGAEILILGYTPVSSYEALIHHNITGTVYNIKQAFAANEAGKKLGKKVKLHIKIDTGMGRLGFLANESSIDEIERISKLPFLEIEGLFSHMARADERDKTSAFKQLSVFKAVSEALEKRGVKIPIKHIANSAAICELMPEFKFDMVRAGIILYGCAPSDEVILNKGDILPAMTLKTEISNIKVVKEQTGISYGHKFITDREMTVATIPIGYADGYTRILSSKVYVGINGKRQRQIGNICMDQCMIELTEDAQIGDEVIIFGIGKEDEPTADDLAKILGTINYEILCMVSRRVPRIYERGGEIVKVLSYLI